MQHIRYLGHRFIQKYAKNALFLVILTTLNDCIDNCNNQVYSSRAHNKKAKVHPTMPVDSICPASQQASFVSFRYFQFEHEASTSESRSTLEYYTGISLTLTQLSFWSERVQEDEGVLVCYADYLRNVDPATAHRAV